MGAVISGVAGAALAIVLMTVAQRSRRSVRMGADGWRVLRPGWLLHGTFVGCLAFSALMLFFLLSGGSSRPDAHTENLYAAALGAGLCLGALHIAWTTYGHAIAWKDDQLRIRAPFGREFLRPFSDVNSIKRSVTGGDYRIKFVDRTSLVFSAYLLGAQELVEQLPEAARDD